MAEHEALAFARDVLGSVWTLEVLLILHRSADKTWHEQELEREVRGSSQIVREAVGVLTRAGLTVASEGQWRYAPATAELASVVAELARLHASKPMLLARTIFTSRSDRIRTFADAFRMRD